VTPTSRLLSWYRTHQRPLPWRGERTPYEIWVSEVMLQQTRSETVAPYYGRFLERFPTVEALASASLDEVLARWSGLGYYRRARALHQAARQVVASGGGLPSTVEDLGELPGIGPYTAAAVASLAFGVAEPVLDGNVARVLARYRAVSASPRRAAGRRRLLAIARELLDADRPGDFNQALMELGARVCRPRRPDCPACPLAPECRALELGAPESFPVADARARTVRERRLIVVVRQGGRLLMGRRDTRSSRLAALWELPWVEASGEPSTTLATRYGGRWTLGPRRGTVRHSITNRILEVEVHRGVWSAGAVAESGALSWIEEARLAELPRSSLVGKALALG
jgi:A/G-specific adenine glycosylase